MRKTITIRTSIKVMIEKDGFGDYVIQINNKGFLQTYSLGDFYDTFKWTLDAIEEME